MPVCGLPLTPSPLIPPTGPSAHEFRMKDVRPQLDLPFTTLCPSSPHEWALECPGNMRG